jgi:MYXO-CTERM domain-containing protein
VIDNCGRAVDCSGMPGFGCGTGETCNQNKCTSTCHPKSTADLCYSAQLKSGLECGTVSDGCGGTVDCGQLPAFRCGGGAACGSDNKCPATSKPSSTTGTAGTDYEQCEGAQDNPELCSPAKGDPGDDGEAAHTSSTRTSSNDKDTDEPAKKSSGVASSGCSSAPGGSSSGFGAVAIAFFLMLGARRRRAGSR